METLVDQIIRGAKASGMSQKDLASRIGITPEALSRGKSRGSLNTASIEKAAQAAGLRIFVLPARKRVKLSPASSVWSSPSKKNDRSMLHARLANASLLDLIELCQAFGPDDVDRALEEVRNEIKPAQYRLERSMLDNVKKGLALAS